MSKSSGRALPRSRRGRGEDVADIINFWKSPAAIQARTDDRRQLTLALG
ncbi:MAG: hypothetical protein U0838_04285 [Chloroflexota bacterium]